MEEMMIDIRITEAVANWYKNEYELNGEGNFRLFVRYGGVGGRIPGFSLGVAMESPVHEHASATVNHLRFFIEEADAWYFEGHNISISLDEETNEPRFTYS